MFKRIIVSIFLIISFSIASNPICPINEELPRDFVSKLDNYRSQYLQTCMNCNDGKCDMKTWPVEQEGNSDVCKKLFCTPVYVSRSFEKPEGAKSGKTIINFTYIVNSKGKIKNLDILESNGVMNARKSYKYLQSFTKKTQYKPLIIDGVATSIALQGKHIAFTGKYEDPDKNMPARSSTWRN